MKQNNPVKKIRIKCYFQVQLFENFEMQKMFSRTIKVYLSLTTIIYAK